MLPCSATRQCERAVRVFLRAYLRAYQQVAALGPDPHVLVTQQGPQLSVELRLGPQGSVS